MMTDPTPLPVSGEQADAIRNGEPCPNIGPGRVEFHHCSDCTAGVRSPDVVTVTVDELPTVRPIQCSDCITRGGVTTWASNSRPLTKGDPVVLKVKPELQRWKFTAAGLRNLPTLAPGTVESVTRTGGKLATLNIGTGEFTNQQNPYWEIVVAIDTEPKE